MSIYAPKKPSPFNVLNFTILAVFSTLIYLGTWYLPHWYSAWVMSGVLVSIGNDAYREYDDAKLMKKLVTEANRRGLPLKEANFIVKRNPYPEAEFLAAKPESRPVLQQRGKSMTMVMGYEVEAEWPLIGKVTKLRFQKQREVDLATIKY